MSFISGGGGGASSSSVVMMSHSGGACCQVVGMVGGATGFPKLELRDDTKIKLLTVSKVTQQYKLFMFYLIKSV